MPGSEYYSIVVIGAMNPRIHHPSWYQIVGIFTKEEAEEALNCQETFGIPHFAQITIPSLLMTIVCQDERWEIRTENRANLTRIQSITGKVFDEFLKHTPIRLFGININLLFETRRPDVSRYLALRTTEMKIGLKIDSDSGVALTLQHTRPGFKSTIVVQQAVNSPRCLMVSSNYEYAITNLESGFFSLRDRISERIGPALKDADEQSDLILQAINDEGGA